jgi:hypothetical protein
MSSESRQIRVPVRCLNPLRSGQVVLFQGDTIEKLKRQLQIAFDVAVGNQILLSNNVRLENDRTYASYLRNPKVAEHVILLDTRLCQTAGILAEDLINAFRMFDAIDFDGGGELSRSEIFVGLMNIGSFSEKEVLAMINAADTDRSDSIDFVEFW